MNNETLKFLDDHAGSVSLCYAKGSDNRWYWYINVLYRNRNSLRRHDLKRTINIVDAINSINEHIKSKLEE